MQKLTGTKKNESSFLQFTLIIKHLFGMDINNHKCFACLFLLTASYWITPVIAQDTHLMKQLQQSNYLDVTMKADSADMGITRWLKKPVEKSRILPLATDFNSLQHTGPGTIQVDHDKTISGKGSILLETPTSLPKKNPTNRAYAFAEVIRPLQGENLKDYNRFSVWVYADAPGFYSFFVGCTLYNGGKHIMPTPRQVRRAAFC